MSRNSVNLEMAPIYPSKLATFILGFTIGTIIGLVFMVSKSRLKGQEFNRYLNSVSLVDEHSLYKKWLSTLGYARSQVNFDYFLYSENKSLDNFMEYSLLKAKVNVLCVVFIKNVDNAYASVDTWMKRCNSNKFYSMKPGKYYIDVTVIRAKHSWHYLCEILRHLYRNSSDYMWVLFVPDGVFAIPDNLRYYVLGKDFLQPHYLGHRAFFWNEQFNLAQAGFVLSKGSIKALVKRFPSSESCEKGGKYWKNEDFYLGKYLAELGVTPTDTRDQLGRGRFHVFNPIQLLAPESGEILKKYWKSSQDNIIQGSLCCSPHTITFQGTDKDILHFYSYLLYRLRVHGGPGKLGNNKSNVFIPSDQVWKQFVLDELEPKANLSAITSEKYYKMWSDKVEPPSVFNTKLRALLLGQSKDKD